MIEAGAEVLIALPGFDAETVEAVLASAAAEQARLNEAAEQAAAERAAEEGAEPSEAGSTEHPEEASGEAAGQDETTSR